MMNKTFCAVVAGLALVACVETGDMAADMAGGAQAITTEAAFRDTVVGKTVTFDGNSLIINSNGTVSGPWDGSGISGTWNWDGAYWCRVVTIGDGDPRPEDCQQWVINGNIATVTRDRGNGASFDYIIS